jgi:thiol:disulfide interchange protein DsbC
MLNSLFKNKSISIHFFGLCLIACLAATYQINSGAQGQEANIKKILAERIPQFPKIEEITRSPMNGLYEIRVDGDEIYYSDADANFLIQGNLIDTRTRKNITEERIEKLTAIDFQALPFKDSIKIIQGNGKRHIAVFEDPNCGYCKRFEKDLQKVENLTIHLFLYPVLGQDSIEKSKKIWCSKDQVKAWKDWMQKEILPVQAFSNCDTQALTRTVEYGRKRKINGTPTIITSDGTRVPGAINTAQIEKLLTEGKF